MAGHIVQHLGYVLAELRHAGTAVGANTSGFGWRLMDDLLPRQVVRQRLAFRLLALVQRMRRIFRRGPGDILGLAGLQFFKLQGELLDLSADPFRAAAKLHAAQLGDLELEFFDLQRSQLNRQFGRLQFRLAGQRKGPQRIHVGGQFSRRE